MGQRKLRLKCTGILAGPWEGPVEVSDGSPIEWDAPIVKAFLDDSELDEVTLVSTQHGFIKTLTKLFTGEKAVEGP